ncbi:MAG: acyl-CoA dehydrogenase family protein [Bradymonadales bacterium]|nr:acyl-CoA dehydrogenase family protein [Bradymonadales bacterium]
MNTNIPFDLFNPTEEHAMLRATVRDFAREVVEPQAEKQDQLGHLNLELMRRCGELGLLGITVPEEYGGANMDTVAAVIAHEELSKADPGFTLAYLAHTMLFVHNFHVNSNAEQRERYLGRCVTGEWIGAMALTEPGGGTDVMSMRTTAVRQGDHYVLNGSKTFITNAPEATLFLVYGKVDGRITSFVVERGFEGFSVGPKIAKLGMRASTMSTIYMEDCVVPAANVLGEPGAGLVNMMRNLEIERLTLAAQSLGIAERCLEEMVSYAMERKAFGHLLVDFGQIQEHIGVSYAKTLAAKTLIYTVARNVHPDARNRLDSDAAKLFAAPVGKEVADRAIQVLGGYGYCQEYKVERFWRDAKLLEIGGGTSESHQKNITRELVRNRPTG